MPCHLFFSQWYVTPIAVLGFLVNVEASSHASKRRLLQASDPRSFVATEPSIAAAYWVSNLYVTTRATRLAKISRAGREFRIIGLIEGRAADRAG